jgi:hypothetical protein
VTFRGRSVFDIPVPRSGLTHSDAYEWRMAAHWDGYHWEDFERLSGDEQSAIVALYRTHLRTEAVLAKDMEQRQRRAQQRGKG